MDFTSDPALDPIRLAQLRALDGPDGPDLSEEVARLFLKGARESIESLVAAVSAGDTGGVTHAAPRLKGSSGNIGAMRLHALCDRMDAAARKGEIEVEMLGAVQSEFRRVERAVRTEFGLS